MNNFVWITFAVSTSPITSLTRGLLFLDHQFRLERLDKVQMSLVDAFETLFMENDFVLDVRGGEVGEHLLELLLHVLQFLVRLHIPGQSHRIE